MATCPGFNILVDPAVSEIGATLQTEVILLVLVQLPWTDLGWLGLVSTNIFSLMVVQQALMNRFAT